MPEQWQNVQTRAQQSLAIWNLHSPAFTVGELTLTLHTTRANGLPSAALARASQQDAVDTARAARDAAVEFIRDMSIRVPRKLDGELMPGDDLLKDVSDVRAIEPGSIDDAEARGIRALSLWQKYNARQAAATPPKPALTVGGKTATNLQVALQSLLGVKTAVSNAASLLNEKRSALTSLITQVDSGNKRWFAAWEAEFPTGVEHDALSDIDTGSSGGDGSSSSTPPAG